MSNEEKKEAKPAKSSRLGKEAKIGIAVILGLLMVLGAVAVMRVTRSNSGDKLASTTGNESKTDAILKDTNAKLFGSVSPPTVVSTKAKPSKTTMIETKHAGNRISPSSEPPSFMPDPPKPPHADRHDRYASDAPAGRDSVNIKPLRDVGSDVVLVAPGIEPPHKEHSRYSDPVLPRQPEATPVKPAYIDRANGGYAAAADGSQYGTNDYRRSSVNTTYNSSEPRRPSASMSYSNPPARRADGKYEVQPNDSYWTISERLYGTGAYFKALAEENRGKAASDDRLKPGDLISAPEVAQLEKSYPDLCPKPGRREALQSQSRASTVSTHNQYRSGRTYTVAEGDTLFNIARYELGKASRWVEIYELNRDVLGKDFNYLTPGIKLAMPEGEKTDTLTRQPGSTYRR